MYQDYKSLGSTIRNIMEQVTKKSLESSGFKNVQEIGNIGFVFLDGVSYRFRRIDSPKKSTRTFGSAEKAKNALVGEWNETRGEKPPEEVPTDKPKSKPEVKPGGMANVTGAAAVVGKPEEKPEPEDKKEPEEKPEPEDKKELPKTSSKTTTDKDKTLEKDINYDVFRKPRGKEGLYKGAEDHIEFHKNFLSGKTDASKHLVEKNQFSFSPELKKEILDDAKFPTHYLDVIERMMNVSPSVKISDVLPRGFVGGAGKIPAQAGEIMTMMGTSMSNKQFSKFYDALSSHLSSSKTDLIVQQAWLDAAANNRAAILTKQSAEGFTHDDIEHSVWDTPQEVEALGLKDYNKNKGFSTDFYMRVQGNLVEQSLKKDEKVNFINSGSGQFASLLMTDDESANFDNLSQQQQDLLSNLHDGKYKSYTELINRIEKIQNKKNIRKKDEDDLKELNEAKKKYDEIENSKPQPPNDINIGGGQTISFDEINQEVAGKNQKQLHLDFFKEPENLKLSQNIIEEIDDLDEEFSNYKKTDLANLKNDAKLSEAGAYKKIQYDLWKKLNEYDGDYSEVFDNIINDVSGSARDNNKCMYLVSSLIGVESSKFKEYKESLNNLDNEFVEKSFAACANDDRMKNGILRAIQKDFPLKLVFKGEENMVIGSNMLDTKIAQRIFGVDSWDEVLPKLQAQTSSKGDPYLAYTGEINGQQKEIPIATIGIRADGKHYGGQWKFEMGLHKSLANEIANHNALEYGLTDHSLLKDLVEIKGDRDFDDEIDSIKGNKSTVRDEMMRLLQGKNNLTTEAKKSIIDKLGQTKKNLFENFISLVVNNYKSLASSIHTILRG